MYEKTKVNIPDSKKPSIVIIHENSFQQFLSSCMVQIIVFGLELWRCTLLVEGRRDILQEGRLHS